MQIYRQKDRRAFYLVEILFEARSIIPRAVWISSFLSFFFGTQTGQLALWFFRLHNAGAVELDRLNLANTTRPRKINLDS
jgi:hypothetical protein